MVLQNKLLFESEITKSSSVPSSGMVTFKSDFLALRINPGTSVVIVVESISCMDFGIVVSVKF